MKVIIPSRGRAGNVRVLEYLKELNPILVVPDWERGAYLRHYPELEVHGVGCGNIQEKRQHILDTWGKNNKIVMIDDDLRFRVRRDDKFVPATPRDIVHMIRSMEAHLDFTPHVGIADEFMCQHNPPGSVEGKRYNQVLGYNFKGWKNTPKYRLTINEEHDMHLQLREKGHMPIVMTDYTKGSKYNAIGGCSTWRTPELEREQFERFARLWPGVVTVVPNENAISGLATRVAWRKVGA